MKRMLLLFFVIVCFLSILNFSATAASDGLLVTVSSAVGCAGDTIVVDIDICENSGFNYLKLLVVYDTDVLILSGAEESELIADKMLVTDGVDNEGAYFLSFTSVDNVTDNGTYAQLSFEIADDAERGEAKISVSVVECHNSDYEDVSFKTVAGTVNVVEARLLSLSDAEAVVGRKFTVYASILANPGINFFKLKIGYDSANLMLVSTENLLDEGLYQTSESVDVNPYVIVWANANDVIGDGVVVRLTFTALGDAFLGETSITISIVECINEKGDDVIFETRGSVVIVKEPDYLLGDCNNDGNIDLKDATLLLKYLADWDVDVVLDASDCNADENVDLKDATLLLKYLAGWDVVFGR